MTTVGKVVRTGCYAPSHDEGGALPGMGKKQPGEAPRQQSPLLPEEQEEHQRQERGASKSCVAGDTGRSVWLVVRPVQLDARGPARRMRGLRTPTQGKAATARPLRGSRPPYRNGARAALLRLQLDARAREGQR